MLSRFVAANMAFPVAAFLPGDAYTAGTAADDATLHTAADAGRLQHTLGPTRG